MNKLLKLELDFHRRNKKQIKNHIDKLKAFKFFDDSTDSKLVDYLIGVYGLALDNTTASYNFYNNLKNNQNKPTDDNVEVI